MAKFIFMATVREYVKGFCYPKTDIHIWTVEDLTEKIIMAEKRLKEKFADKNLENGPRTFELVTFSVGPKVLTADAVEKVLGDLD